MSNLMESGAVVCLVSTLALVTTSTASAQFATGIYFIDQQMNYETDHGCGVQDNCDNDTLAAAWALEFRGWVGNQYVDDAAWPQDFMESCPDPKYGAGGLDNLYGDNAKITIFSGHANAGKLSYAYPHNGICDVIFSSNMRLGSMGGAQASHGIFYGCCTMPISSLVAHANRQWLSQAFGFLDDEANDTEMLAEFIYATETQSNVGAWLSEMEDRPAWFTGDNSPIVVSYGATAAAASFMHSYSAIYRNNVMTHRDNGPSCGAGQPRFTYTYTAINHNNGC
jgi:hypothetical protein